MRSFLFKIHITTFFVTIFFVIGAKIRTYFLISKFFSSLFIHTKVCLSCRLNSFFFVLEI